MFDNMLERSIPFYKECQKMVLALTAELHQPGTSVYDLGCSTGTLLKRLAATLPKKNRAHWVGVDNSAPMLKKARRKLKEAASPCDLIEADLEEDFAMANASVVILNYTLQFVPPKRRPSLLKKIHKNLLPGGGLILIEKVLSENSSFDDLFLGQYHGFKQKKGYSQMEISRKREALEQILVPLTPGKNAKMLEKSGFTKVDLFFKWFNFAGWVAVKN